MPYKNLFKLPPEITHVVLGGRAFIDQEGLDIASHAHAQDFALNYGFNVNLPHHRSQVVQTFHDAMAFLETDILDETELKIPAKIAKTQDPLDLLVWASASPRDAIAEWSCAILRIMHTLLYIDNNIFLRFLPEIQRQVFERYDRYIVQRRDGRWFLEGKYQVPLLDIKQKDGKNRNSMALKLLHKPENVTETIYDNIGIRFVAEDILDTLLVLRFLIDHNVFQAAHIKPSRTRNLIIDNVLLEEWVDLLPNDFSVHSLSPAQRQDISEKLAQRIGRPSVNPFSSRDYSALQLTVNTLVRLPGPGISALKKVQQIFMDNGKPEMSDQFHVPELISAQEEFAFFFAHEVQFMEKTGFDNSRLGPSSHSEYKHRQRKVVRKRLLRGLLSQGGTC
ncbi:MAG: TIGR04552 family protein [Holophagaceae bacterium]|nr:TIGR04552 family protein [Holophagaceae bacterium]